MAEKKKTVTLDLGWGETPLADGKPRYARLERLGEGATAEVYRGLDRLTGATIVIKALKPHLAADPVSLERFKREMQVTRSLSHPQIVLVRDMVVRDDGVELIMDFAPGVSLKEQILTRGAPHAWQDALPILHQLLSIAAACHATGIVHRDLKPQNVMIDERGTLRLLDFGIARMAALADLTHTGSSVGTPEYMAPEQFATIRCDQRADLYAIGVIAYEVLTGRVPFLGDSIGVLYRQHLEETPEPLSRRRPDVPAWLDAWVARLLEKQPYRRYQSADEALSDLEARRAELRALPRGKQRCCDACGRQTLFEFPLCTQCGHDERRLLVPGGVELVTAEGTDRRLLHRFCLDELKVLKTEREVHPYATQVVVSGINPLVADELITKAKARGIVLHARSIRRNPALTEFSRTMLVGGATAAFLLLVARASSGMTLWPGRVSVLEADGGMSFRAMVGFAIGAMLWVWFRRRHGNPNEPLVAAYLVARGRGYMQTDKLFALGPFFRSRAAPESKAAIAGLLETHHQLGLEMRRRGAQPASLWPRLESLADGLVKLASRLGDLDAETARLEPAVLTESLLEARRSGNTKAELRLTEEVSEYYFLEDRIARLNNLLVKLQQAYYACVGRIAAAEGAHQIPHLEALKREADELVALIDAKEEVESVMGVAA